MLPDGLPYKRTINYFSASALRQMEANPVEFYLRRLGPYEYMPAREEQSFPAAVGISFDGHVKWRLAQIKGTKCPSLGYLLHEIRCERQRAIDLGRQLLAGYEKSGALASLVDDGIGMLAVTFEDFLPGTEVPFQCKLDGLCFLDGKTSVHDWKVAGANTPGERSPTKGYARLWDTATPLEFKAHKKPTKRFEEVDHDWATQLAIYSLICDPKIRDRTASIDEVVVGKDGRVRTAQHRARITAKYQKQVCVRAQNAWERIQAKAVVPEKFAKMGLEMLRVMA